MRSRALLFSSLDVDRPRRLSAAQVLAHLSVAANWPEGAVSPPHTRHPAIAEYPLLRIEFHGAAGFSLHIFPNEKSPSFFAATKSTLSAPSIYVCLGGQVIEKWPSELFLPRELALAVLNEFMTTQLRPSSCAWVRLDHFPRHTVHTGGRGLIPLWEKLKRNARFPFAAE
jgi:hypothetical protein